MSYLAPQKVAEDPGKVKATSRVEKLNDTALEESSSASRFLDFLLFGSEIPPHYCSILIQHSAVVHASYWVAQSVIFRGATDCIVIFSVFDSALLLFIHSHGRRT